MIKINNILKQNDAMPDQENWPQLEEKFQVKYREMEAFMKDPQNRTTEYTDEIGTMDDELCQLFYQLHDVEEIEAENNNAPLVDTHGRVSAETETDEPENETEENNQIVETNEMVETDENNNEIVSDENNNITEKVEDMKKKNEHVEAHNNASEKNDEIQEQTTEKVIDENGSGEGVPENHQNNDETVETQNNTPETNNIQEYPEFLAYADNQKVISAKDLKQYGVPEQLWKTKKEEFTIGHLTFRKTPAGLMFNKWQVVK